MVNSIFFTDLLVNLKSGKCSTLVLPEVLLEGCDIFLGFSIIRLKIQTIWPTCLIFIANNNLHVPSSKLKQARISKTKQILILMQAKADDRWASLSQKFLVSNLVLYVQCCKIGTSVS
jgi:hypothetical protein